MSDKKLDLILRRLDKLDRLDIELKKMQTEYDSNERLQKIEDDIKATRKWITTQIQHVATIYEIVKNNGREVLVKRQEV